MNASRAALESDDSKTFLACQRCRKTVSLLVSNGIFSKHAAFSCCCLLSSWVPIRPGDASRELAIEHDRWDQSTYVLSTSNSGIFVSSNGFRLGLSWPRECLTFLFQHDPQSPVPGASIRVGSTRVLLCAGFFSLSNVASADESFSLLLCTTCMGAMQKTETNGIFL